MTTYYNPKYFFVCDGEHVTGAEKKLNGRRASSSVPPEMPRLQSTNENMNNFAEACFQEVEDNLPEDLNFVTETQLYEMFRKAIRKFTKDDIPESLVDEFAKFLVGSASLMMATQSSPESDEVEIQLPPESDEDPMAMD
jgi:hypothetical protein